MKTRTIFFLYYRAGSTLIECICGKPWRIAQVQGNIEESNRLYHEWRASNQPFLFPTIERCVSEDIAIPITETMSQYKDEEHFAYMTHIGDWWGDLRSDNIPLPYEGVTPNRWGPIEITATILDVTNWRFISLIRDGRNQIESLRKFKGGFEAQKMKEDPDDYFKVLCKGFRNRASIALDCQRLLFEQYKIFRFEDFIQDPIRITSDMFSFAGLTLNTSKISLPTSGEHSSFGESSNYTDRWHSWTTQEKDIFKEIAGRELIALGYEKDNNW